MIFYRKLISATLVVSWSILLFTACDVRDGFPDELVGKWAYWQEWSVADDDTIVYELSEWGLDSVHLEFRDDQVVFNTLYRPDSTLRDRGFWELNGNILDMDLKLSGNVNMQMELLDDTLKLFSINSSSWVTYHTHIYWYFRID